MTGALTPLLAETLLICIQRQEAGKTVTVAGVASTSGRTATMTIRAFRRLRLKGYLALIDEPHHRVVRDVSGAMLDKSVYRRIAEDGVEVTQCPVRYAQGYGFDGSRLIDE